MKRRIRIGIRINYEENDKDTDGIIKRRIRIGMRMRL